MSKGVKAVPVIKKPPHPGMKALRQERERLQQQMFRLFEQSEAVRNQLAGLEKAILILERGDKADAAAEPAPESATNLKALLLDLAREAGTTGINSNTAVTLAAKRGVKLLRGSAASNLSRLKADKALIHDGTAYRLPEFTRATGQMQLAVHAGGKGS